MMPPFPEGLTQLEGRPVLKRHPILKVVLGLSCWGHSRDPVRLLLGFSEAGAGPR